MKKILIIDDDEMNREVMEAFLSSEQFEVFLAHNGKNGLQTASEILPDLVILDVKMPDMLGYEVCARLRRNPDTQHTSIMIVTGYDDPQEQERAKEAGANVFLSRPFSGEELIETVSNLIGS